MINVRQKTRQRALFGVPLEPTEMARSLKADGEIVQMDVLVQVRQTFFHFLEKFRQIMCFHGKYLVSIFAF